MKQPYFNTPQRQSALVTEARSWIGTPFRENCAVRGRDGGVDCIHFLHAVMVAVGATKPQKWKAQPVEIVRRWHEHHTTSQILEWLTSPQLRGRVRKVEADEAPLIGDLVVLKVQHTEHHLALDIGPEAAHVAIPAGVITHSLRDPEFGKLVVARYRVMAKGRS